MAVIKCKMCGGDLVIEPGATVAECEYCGSRQTVPTADNEKKLTLFARANRLRAACEFDKAAGVYEAIVADFPQEAEAYWGLVLCKYGIEYVDDPATGKKIPTCHRSSFESVLDDSNFDQAQENADVVARKIYREEAKQIETLRKGIIEVSAQEAPYDIFICYKETDEKGDRTLDSVLAQDIYDALTEKGYRVFFSRITLEDKLGQAYEPYIFAALNSAKIMLAVGTDYEYYNAVWVKNEWSRYLMLMAKDRTRHLIPCYKNIDAYDMPKEFAKLQAQDMGKVGAMQDLLRGIEKLLPKNQPVTVVQEKVIVGGSGDNKIASLLDRGNMALEDGDWAKADSFFEDVLNNDSKNAQAYIGKTLVQEQCRTMDALVRKRLGVYGQVQAETLTIPERTEHIAQMAEKFAMPRYVKSEDIQKLYKFDRTYPSEVSGRQAQYREEERWWANHKLLSRAEKFASGAVAEQLQQEKQRLFAQLADRVKKAQAADAQSAAALEKAYDAAIQEADAKAEQLYQENFDLRESRYQYFWEQAQVETNPQKLLALAKQFDTLTGDYKDSTVLAKQCRAKAELGQAKIDTKRKWRKAITLTIVLAVVATAWLVTQVILSEMHYTLLSSGQHQEAAAAFEALGNYGDSDSPDLSAVSIENAGHAMTHAEYIAAELDSEVCVETYVQAHQSWWDGKITVYAQSEDGAYFIYNMACTEEDADKLVPGTKILVKGVKAEWSGEVEIVDATFEIEEGSFIAEPVDVTDLLGKEELIDHQNELVSVKGLTVEKVKYKNDEPGDDIYVTLALGELTVEFQVETYLTDSSSEVYTAVSALNVGDVVDVEGFLYWYNGANTHLTKVSKH